LNEKKGGFGNGLRRDSKGEVRNKKGHRQRQETAAGEEPRKRGCERHMPKEEIRD